MLSKHHMLALTCSHLGSVWPSTDQFEPRCAATLPMVIRTIAKAESIVKKYVNETQKQVGRGRICATRLNFYANRHVLNPGKGMSVVHCMFVFGRAQEPILKHEYSVSLDVRLISQLEPNRSFRLMLHAEKCP